MARVVSPGVLGFLLVSSLLLGVVIRFALSGAGWLPAGSATHHLGNGDAGSRERRVAKAPATLATPRTWSTREGLYLKRNWGVEVIGVEPMSSGYMLGFRYRILDAEKAKLLHDRKARAYLIDDKTGTRLAVPALENIGELRTGAAPQADRNYYMVFGNPGRLVRPGDHVTIVIGELQIGGIIVKGS
jgi:hypothetical protein